jgi:hypothetical protein
MVLCSSIERSTRWSDSLKAALIGRLPDHDACAVKNVRYSLLVGLLVVPFGLSVACSSSKTPTQADGSAGLDGGVEAAGATGSGGITGAGGGAGGAGGVSQGGVPTVVATLDAVPVSLALAGDRVYVTLFPTHGGDGKVESIAKTATDASADGGTAVTTLASGLPSPGAIAVNGSQVLWIDDYQVISVPVTGGSTSTLFNNTDVASAVLANVRLPIVNSVFYSTSDNGQTIRAYPLGAADGGIGISTTVFTRSGEGLTYAVDSDGSSLFFLNASGNGSDTPYDLTESPVAGGPATVLAANAGGGSANGDYIVDDATTVYWSDSGSGSVSSVPKAGGTVQTLATFPTGSAPVQIVLDGDNIYALWDRQLVRLPKAGGTPVVLASVSNPTAANSYRGLGSNAISLAVDDSFVYWLFAGPQQILKIAK